MIDAPSFSTPLNGALPAPTDPTLIVALTCLFGVTLVVFAMLRAWQDWLELKRRELDTQSSSASARDESPQLSVGTARIELADMKERIKKLEAIASGVEL
ncbi:MAG: hypothetical protein AAGH57_06230 [Pseudomonadota bacterium]